MAKKEYKTPEVKDLTKYYHSGNATKKDFPDSRNERYERSEGSEPTSATRAKTGLSLLSLVVCVLLVAMLIRKFTGNNTVPSFTSLLEFLSSVKAPTIPFLKGFSLSPLDEWAIMDGLRVFLNSFVDLFNVVIFIFNGILSVITYVVIFFQWLFV